MGYASFTWLMQGLEGVLFLFFHVISSNWSEQQAGKVENALTALQAGVAMYPILRIYLVILAMCWFRRLNMWSYLVDSKSERQKRK